MKVQMPMITRKSTFVLTPQHFRGKRLILGLICVSSLKSILNVYGVSGGGCPKSTIFMQIFSLNFLDVYWKFPRSLLCAVLCWWSLVNDFRKPVLLWLPLTHIATIINNVAQDALFLMGWCTQRYFNEKA